MTRSTFKSFEPRPSIEKRMKGINVPIFKNMMSKISDLNKLRKEIDKLKKYIKHEIKQKRLLVNLLRDQQISNLRSIAFLQKLKIDLEYEIEKLKIEMNKEPAFSTQCKNKIIEILKQMKQFK